MQTQPNGGRPPDSRICLRPRTLMMLLALTVGFTPFLQANVLTEPLAWRETSLELGLNRIKDNYLDDSIWRDREYVGGIFRHTDGSFGFSYGRGHSGQDQVRFRVQVHAGTEIVGFWHTHGAHGPGRALFSPVDAELVRQTGLPFYLITPAGEIRVLRPTHLRQQRAPGAIFGRTARLPRGAYPGEPVAGVRGSPAGM